ncbi:MAG: hypothetical protein ABW220_04920 [Burkholderiaceae bacterium]
MTTRIKLPDLVEAYDWASTGGQYESAAYVTRSTGRIWLVSDFDELGDQPPDDVDDESLYVPVPRQDELDLARRLAVRFAEEHLPEQSEQVASYFSKAGAYARFKNLLMSIDQLDAWLAYRDHGVEAALRAWAADNDIEVSAD